MNIIFKNQKKVKLFAILLVCTTVFSMPSFSVEVSDNDGSAFITKAEFDALKSNFQSQIDTYNTSIDSKIDTAIASYLAGIKIAKYEDRNLLLGTQGKKLTFFNSNANQDLAYVYAPPRVTGNTVRTEVAQDLAVGLRNYIAWAETDVANSWAGMALMMTQYDNSKSDFTRFCSKTAIENLDETKKIAKWAGYYTNCLDEVVIYNRNEGFANAITIADWDYSIFSWGFHPAACYLRKDQDLYGKSISIIYGYDPSDGQNHAQTDWTIWSTIADFNNKSENIYASLYNFNYDMFSNRDRNYNWGYDGTYQTIFDGYENKIAWQRSNTFDCYTDIYNTMTAGGGVFHLWSFAAMDTSLAPIGRYVKKQVKYTKDETGGNFFNPGNGVNADSGLHYIPMLGFETTYLTNWGQIYNEDFDNYITAGATSVITDATGKKHMSMTNGVPFITLASGEEMEYTFDFVDKTQDYWIWLKTSPFLNENKVLPGTNETTINLINAGTKSNGAYKIASGTGTIKYKNESGSEETLYLKFGAGDLNATTIKSGTLILGKATITLPD